MKKSLKNQNPQTENTVPDSSVLTNNNNNVETEEINKIISESENLTEPLKEKKPSKYKLNKQAESEKNEAFALAVSGLGATLLDLLIKRMPNPVPLDKTEKESINKSFDLVAKKYAPVLGNYQEEAGLILVVTMILYPRYKSNNEEVENVTTESKTT